MWRSVGAVTGFCFVIQLASALALDNVESPNPAAEIARLWRTGGLYEGGTWRRLKGPDVDPYAPHRPRLLHLPGEPIYLVGWYRVMPSAIEKYAHLPVTVGLVALVTWVGCLIAGPRVGLLAGLFASVQPFVVIHGPVLDNQFLAAALDWLVVGVLLLAFVRPDGSSFDVGRAGRLALIAMAAGFASITRSQSTLIFALLAFGSFALASLRRMRLEAVAILVGMAVALGAWGVRNRMVSGEFFLGSSYDGITLWESNAPFTRHTLWYGGQVEVFNNTNLAEDFAVTRAMADELDIHRYYSDRAVDYFRAHPLDVFATGLFKLFLSLSGFQPERSLVSLRNLVGVGSQLLLFVLSGYGLVVLWRILDPALRRVLLCFALAMTIPTVLLLMIGPHGLRYRFPVDGILWIASGAALDRWLRPG